MVNNEDLDFAKTGVKYLKRYWLLFVCAILLAAANGYLYLKITPKKYKSSASILVNDEKKGSEGARAQVSVDPFTATKLVENEIIILKSNEVLQNVVDQLGLYKTLASKTNFSTVSIYPNNLFAIDVDSAAVASFGVIEIPFAYTAGQAFVIVDKVHVPFGQWAQSPNGKFRITRKDPAAPSGEYHFRVEDRHVSVEMLANGLDVMAANKLASVITIETTGDNKKRSEDILNAVIAAYNQQATFSKMGLAENSLEVINSRLAASQTSLDSIETKLQRYKRSAGAVDLTSQSKLMLEGVTENAKKLTDIERKIAVINDLSAKIDRQNGALMIAPASIDIDDPLLVKLFTQLYEQELEYERLKPTTATNNAIMVSLRERIDKLKPAIRSHLSNYQSSLTKSKFYFNKANQSMATDLDALPEREKEIVEISRERSKLQEIHDFLLEKKEEAVLSLSKVAPGINIVEKAKSNFAPVAPKPMLVYLIALAICLSIAVLIAFILDRINSKIYSRDEIESDLKWPIISEIGVNGSGKEIVVNYNQKIPVGEDIRRLRGSLSYLGLKGTKNSVMVTSSISGEGKSFIATNLALSFEAAGRRTALVEFDLYNPTIGTKLNMETRFGIVDYLRGDCALKEIFYKVPGYDSLYLIPAGSVGEFSSDLLLNSDEIQALFDEVKSKFDYSVVDSPPIGYLTDAYVISSFCDKSLFVVRHQVTPRAVIRRISKDTALGSLNNLSVVYNGNKQTLSKRGYYAY